MILIVPAAPDPAATPFYKMEIALEGRTYVFDFRYNQREDAWYFSIYLPDGTLLAGGIKVVCRVDFLARFADVRLPPGMLTALSNDASNEEPPGLLELGEGRRVTMFYTTSDEVFA